LLKWSHQSERRLFVVDWAKIRTEYIKTGLAYRKLAAKHNISFNTLKNRAIKEKWVELRKQKENKTTTKTIESLSDKESEQAISIQSAADLILKRTSELLNSAPVTTLESLKTAASTLKILKEVMDVKGDADMREQEARIAKLQRDAEKEDDTITQVDVVFAAGPEEWNG
jgi:hypothetical protein